MVRSNTPAVKKRFEQKYVGAYLIDDDDDDREKDDPSLSGSIESIFWQAKSSQVKNGQWLAVIRRDDESNDDEQVFTISDLPRYIENARIDQPSHIELAFPTEDEVAGEVAAAAAEAADDDDDDEDTDDD